MSAEDDDEGYEDEFDDDDDFEEDDEGEEQTAAAGNTEAPGEDDADKGKQAANDENPSVEVPNQPETTSDPPAPPPGPIASDVSPEEDNKPDHGDDTDTDKSPPKPKALSVEVPGQPEKVAAPATPSDPTSSGTNGNAKTGLSINEQRAQEAEVMQTDPYKYGAQRGQAKGLVEKRDKEELEAAEEEKKEKAREDKKRKEKERKEKETDEKGKEIRRKHRGSSKGEKEEREPSASVRKKMGATGKGAEWLSGRTPSTPMSPPDTAATTGHKKAMDEIYGSERARRIEEACELEAAQAESYERVRARENAQKREPTMPLNPSVSTSLAALQQAPLRIGSPSMAYTCVPQRLRLWWYAAIMQRMNGADQLNLDAVEQMEYSKSIFNAMEKAGYAGIKLGAKDLLKISKELPMSVSMGFMHMDNMFEAELSTYSPVMLQRRGALRGDPRFRVAVERIWRTFEARGELSLNATTGIVYLAEDPFVRFQLRVSRALCPSQLEWTPKQIEEMMKADWANEAVQLANGTLILQYDTFFKYMFNIVDTWTFTTGVNEALVFVDVLMSVIEEAPMEYPEDCQKEPVVLQDAPLSPGTAYYRSSAQLTSWRALDTVMFAVELYQEHQNTFEFEEQYQADDEADTLTHETRNATHQKTLAHILAENDHSSNNVKGIRPVGLQKIGGQSNAAVQRGILENRGNVPPSSFVTAPPPREPKRDYTLWEAKPNFALHAAPRTPPMPRKVTKYDRRVLKRPGRVPLWEEPLPTRGAPSSIPPLLMPKTPFGRQVVAAEFGRTFGRHGKVFNLPMGTHRNERTLRIYQAGQEGLANELQTLRRTMEAQRAGHATMPVRADYAAVIPWRRIEAAMPQQEQGMPSSTSDLVVQHWMLRKPLTDRGRRVALPDSDVYLPPLSTTR